MALESHSRQALGEEVGGLALARYFEELDLMRSCQLAHPVYACVYVFGALVHTRALDEKDARIIVLHDEGRPCLWVSEHFHDVTEIHSIECTLRHTVEFAFCAADCRDGLTFGCPHHHGAGEHDGVAADAAPVLCACVICIRASCDLISTYVLAHGERGWIGGIPAICDATVARTCEVAQHAFDGRDVCRTWIVHEARALVHGKAAVSASEACEIHTAPTHCCAGSCGPLLGHADGVEGSLRARDAYSPRKAWPLACTHAFESVSRCRCSIFPA